MPIVFRTATALNGYLADGADSLAWLFEVPGRRPDHVAFLESVTAMVVGSTTYEYVLREQALLDRPEQWQTFFGDRPMFVFSSRALDVPEGADVRVVSGGVGEHLPAIRAAAGRGTVWVQGGGDLVGQFIDVGALDQITLTVAPVTLAGGRPLLPRELRWDRLRLAGVEQVGEFAVLTYDVRR
jgi:dihydrofolate reductase